MPAKVPHVEPNNFIVVATIPGNKLLPADLANVPKASIGKITLQVFTGQKFFLVNLGGTAVELPAGHVVAGFGAGSFQHKPRATIYTHTRCTQFTSPLDSPCP